MCFFKALSVRQVVGCRDAVPYTKSSNERELTDECVNLRRTEREDDGGPSGTRRTGAGKTVGSRRREGEVKVTR